MNDNLPACNEPLVLADGTVIDPSTGREAVTQSQYIEIPDAEKAQNIVGRTKRRVVDLPELPKTMNAIGIVLMYTMYGLARQEIAIATGLSIEQIRNIRELDAYHTLEGEIVDNILHVDADNIKTMLAKAAHAAATRITTLIDSEDEVIQLSASKDVLSRTGHTANDDRLRQGMSESLNIIITVKNDNDARPMVNIAGE